MSSTTQHDTDEVDVVALSPPPSLDENADNGEKKYYCQRCLNHDEFHPRKGHKPVCKYSNCLCTNCSMVETRRQLNNKLKNPPVAGTKVDKKLGPKGRNPNCARCQAHGVITQLKGHKKNQCKFADCTCEKCQLVCIRRNVMAQQIKLRRNQKRARNCGTGRQSTESSDGHTSDSNTPSPAPPQMLPLQMPHFVMPQPLAMRPVVPPVLQPLMFNAVTAVPPNPLTMYRMPFPNPSEPCSSSSSSSWQIGYLHQQIARKDETLKHLHKSYANVIVQQDSLIKEYKSFLLQLVQSKPDTAPDILRFLETKAKNSAPVAEIAASDDDIIWLDEDEEGEVQKQEDPEKQDKKAAS